MKKTKDKSTWKGLNTTVYSDVFAIGLPNIKVKTIQFGKLFFLVIEKERNLVASFNVDTSVFSLPRISTDL